METKWSCLSKKVRVIRRNELTTRNVKIRRVAMVQWLRQKTHDREVLGSIPHYGDHFSGTIHLDQSLEQKLWKTLTWHRCMCCNPANGRVDFVNGRRIKSSYMVLNELQACQLTETKAQQKKKRNIKILKAMANCAKFERLTNYSCKFGEASHIFLKNGIWRMLVSLVSPCNMAARENKSKTVKEAERAELYQSIQSMVAKTAPSSCRT